MRFNINCVLSLFAALSLTLMTACSDDANPVGPKSEKPPDPFAQNARLGRGMNLGNALEAPKEGDWGVTLKSGDRKSVV